MIPLGVLAGSRPGGPQVLTSDSFNRSNGAISGSTDAALGGTPLPWYTDSYSYYGLEVISNQLGSEEYTDTYAYATVNVGVSSMVVSAMITSLGQVALSASSRNAQPDWDSAYQLLLDSYGGLELMAGAYDYDQAPDGTVANGDLVELVSDYPSVSARVNGVTVMSLTDTSGSAPTGKYAGVSTGFRTNWRLDDFKVEVP